MMCQDVGVEACSRRPLCPCFQSWDRQVRVNEWKVMGPLRVAEAAVATIDVVLAASEMVTAVGLLAFEWARGSDARR